MKPSRAVKEVVQESFDYETGELKQSSSVIELSSFSEPPYVKLYLNDIGKLFELPRKCTDILHILVRRMDYDGYVSLGINGKKRMAEELGMKNTQSIDNYLQTLKKQKIITTIGRGEYMLDPNIFAKGEWREIYKKRKDYLRLIVDYDLEGNRKISSEVI